MPDSVKISELDPRAAVGTDVLPAVDSAFNSTVRVTASSIAAIGGGPPGDGTVTTAKIVNGAVTAIKTSFLSTDRLLGRAAAGAGNGEEIPCTSYARGLLATADSAAALSYLGGIQSLNNPTFTGTTTVATLAVTGNSTHAGNAEFSGTISTLLNGTQRPVYGARAWVMFGYVEGQLVVRGSAGVASVAIINNAAGLYRITMAYAMPDDDYAVVLTARDVQTRNAVADAYYNAAPLAAMNWNTGTGGNVLSTTHATGGAKQPQYFDCISCYSPYDDPVGNYHTTEYAAIIFR